MYINFTFLFKKNDQNSIYSRYFLLVILSLSIFINASSQYLGGNGGGNAMFYLPTAPSAPTNLQVSPANGELFINFTAGSDGGGAITNYKYSLDNGATWIACNPALTASPVNIKYLTNATAYNVQLRAVNAAGDGAVSTAISGTPTTTYLTSLGGVTIVASGGDAEGITWFYANKTIMPISSTPVNLNVADVLSKLSSDLTIAGSNINVNTNIVKTASSKLIFNTPGTINLAADVTTDAAVIYNGVVSTSGARNLKGSKLWVNGSLTGDNNISLNATNGNVVVMSNIVTTGIFSATATANTFAMGVDLLNGRGAKITADGGVSINANNTLLAGKLMTNNTAINIAGNIQVAHFAATASPLLFDSRNGAIYLTGGVVTNIIGESVDYALLVANAAKNVAGSNVTISKVVDGSNRYLVYQYTTVGNDLFFTPYQVSSADYLVVAGGGGGGGSVLGAYAGGGGGGGGVANGSVSLGSGIVKFLEVGAGGAIGSNQIGSNPSNDGTNGANSFLDNILAGGGGGAGASSSLISGTGRSGLNGNGGLFYTAGGGGGGVGSNSSATPGAGGLGSQRNGGSGAGKSFNEPGSGGPGGGAVGNASRGNDNAANGYGAGFVSTITGTSIEYGKGSITYSYSRYNTIPGGGSAALSYYNGYSGAGNDGTIILRHVVGNEINHITTNGISIGNTDNTGDVTNSSTVNLAGPIALHGSNLNINATLTSTNSDINLYAINSATQTASLAAVGLGLHGTGTFTLTNTNNNVINFAAGTSECKPATISFTDASGGLAIGTVGTLTGTTSLGDISIETLEGNISLSQNISTSSSSAYAITLNAGKNTAISTLTGGDILIIGSPTITMGSGGIAKLFSGDPATSTGLINLSGGVSNARFLVDETSSSFSPILITNNTYALFRGNPPVVSAIGSISRFVVCEGATYYVQSFIVAGSNLTADILVTAPSGYEISLTSGSGFTNSITLPTTTNTVANTNIYLRLKSDAVNGDFGNVSITSTGASSLYIGLPPAIIATIPLAPNTTATVNYTIGDVANILSATALTNHSLKWYSVATAGTATNTAYTPTTNTAGTQMFYVSQVNSAGCESIRAEITVIISNPTNTLQAPAGLTYPSISEYTVGVAISTLTPTSTGGAISSYAISPSLPAGLTMNTTTGGISGTPTTATSIGTYTITATNATGSTTTTITFSVNIPAPAGLTYPSISEYTVGVAISTLTPTSTGGAISSYAISPSLPAGLTMNTTTGGISGTPTTATSIGTYTITATNATGSTTTTITFSVNIPTPAGLTYPSISEYTVGVAISTLTPTSTGGAISSYAISPSLPAGLTMNTTTGGISGTPTTATSIGTYTITATNATGSTTTTITFVIKAATENITLPQGELNTLDFELLASDTIKLKLTTTAGNAPFTLILSNNINQIKDTITNLIPVDNDIVFSNKTLDTTKVFTIFKLIDADNIERTTGFIKDTTIIRLLKPLLAMNLTASNPVKQKNGTYLMRLNLVIKNLGDVLLNNVQVDANLYNVFGTSYRFNLSNVKIIQGDAKLNPFYTGIGASNVSISSALSDMTKIQLKQSSNSNKRSLSLLSENYLFEAGTNLNLTEQNEVAFDIIVTPIAASSPLTLQFASSASAVIQKADGTVSSQVASASSNNASNILNHPNVTGVGTPNATVVGFPPNAPIVISKKYILNNSNNPTNLRSLITNTSAGSIVYWCNLNQTICDTVSPAFPSAIGKYTYILKSYDTLFKLYSDTVSISIDLVAPTDLLKIQQTIGEPILQENLTYNFPLTITLNNKSDFLIDSILVDADLKSLFPSVIEYKVLSVNSTNGIKINPLFNGDTQIGLTLNTSSIAGSAREFIYVLLNINQKSNINPLPTLSKVKAKTYLGIVNIASAPLMDNNGEGVPTMIQLPLLGIEIPEIFTPNRDGVNDRFVIKRPYGVRIDLEVYNRWGTKVFTRNNYQNDWDGRGDNAFFGQDLVDGGYYYTIKVLNNNGTTQILKGFIIIQR